MRWLIDTSVWSRRSQPVVARQLQDLYDEGDDFAIAAPALLEILRAPQGFEVQSLNEAIASDMDIAYGDRETFQVAAQAMLSLARHSPTAHRKSVVDLLTAALAHQHGYGVVHADSDFSLIAAHSGLDFRHRTFEVLDSQRVDSAGATQRRLKKEMSQLLHRLPVDQAERALKAYVDDLRLRL